MKRVIILVVCVLAVVFFLDSPLAGKEAAKVSIWINGKKTNYSDFKKKFKKSEWGPNDYHLFPVSKVTIKKGEERLVFIDGRFDNQNFKAKLDGRIDTLLEFKGKMLKGQKVFNDGSPYDNKIKALITNELWKAVKEFKINFAIKKVSVYTDMMLSNWLVEVTTPENKELELEEDNEGEITFRVDNEDDNEITIISPYGENKFILTKLLKWAKDPARTTDRGTVKDKPMKLLGEVLTE